MLKKLFKNLLSLLFGLIAAFFIAEIVLRFVPVELTEYNSTFAYTPDAQLGYLPASHQKASFNLSCVRNAQITSNSLGFRDGEWTDKRPLIAALGDSYLLGLSVPDSSLVTARLEKLTGGEVLNTGVSGFGTYHEWLMWNKHIKQRKPDVVLLFLFLRNDVRDNLCALSRPGGQNYSPCADVVNDSIVYRDDFYLPPPSSGFKGWVKKNCLTCRIVKNLRKNSKDKTKGASPFGVTEYAYNVYRKDAPEEWEDAWHVTEEMLHRLKQSADSAGAKFLIVSVPDVFLLAEDWKAALAPEIPTDQLPADFDPQLPRRRLTEIAARSGTEVLHLEDAFREYASRFKLPHPQFSFCCDGHWNPLGHTLAAHLTSHRLRTLWQIPSPIQPGEEAAFMYSSPSFFINEGLLKQITQCETASY